MRHQKPRRGIVLLIVLSLLTLFALLMVTFLVISGQYERTARASARPGQTGDHPRKLLDTAMYQAVRDTQDPRSVLRGHSLLHDMYGVDGFKGLRIHRVGLPGAFASPAVADGTDSQFIDIVVRENDVRDLNRRAYRLSHSNGYYNGCVLTFTSGAARGLSVRIVGYEHAFASAPVNGIGLLRLFIPKSDGSINVTPAAEDRFVVNGRPFNGTGFGYNPSTGQLDERVPNTLELSPQSALLPNQFLSTEFVGFLRGHADEGYDAPDYQNMALAALSTDNATPNVLPSYHRPALVNYWFNRLKTAVLASVAEEDHLSYFLQPFGFDNVLGTADDPGGLSSNELQAIANFKRKFILRPLPEFNANFSGSTKAFTATELANAGQAYRNLILSIPFTPVPGGTPEPASVTKRRADFINPYVSIPFDIDNSGNGQLDSIWLDLDFPVNTARDGRMVKPLFSMLIIDTAGRASLNAHGSLAHTPGVSALTPGPSRTRVLAQDGNSLLQPEGQGYGPPEINLSYIFNDAAQTPTQNRADYDRLMRGNQQNRGRYGNNSRPGVGSIDQMAAVKFFEYPRDYFDRIGNPLVNHRTFHNPPDLRGEMAFGLDHRGMPTYERSNSSVVPNYDLISDSPYELDLSFAKGGGVSTARSSDMPFSITELERLLRYQDADAGLLPNRLTKLFDTFTTGTGAASKRRMVTTHSYDLPSPNIAGTSDIRATLAFEERLRQRTASLRSHDFPRHVTDIFRARMLQSSGILGWLQSVAAAGPSPQRAIEVPARLERIINAQLVSMVSPDLVMGLRMDVNRPFGNGIDDNNDGVIDDPAEALIDERIWRSIYGAAGVGFDHDNDGVVGGDGNAPLARSHYARQLYCLLMALKDPSHVIDYYRDGDGFPGPPGGPGGPPGPGGPGLSSPILTEEQETARAIAQWVINVVDFRDSDSIMTPFEFDSDPFSFDPGPDGEFGIAGVDDDGANGTDDLGEYMAPGSDDVLPWSVDGMLSPTDDVTDYGRRLVVWGSERPELLLSSTLAFHDRRTEDLSTPQELTTRLNDDGDLIGEVDFEMFGGPNDYDQRLRPRGSLFIELYNPWTSRDTRVPEEFYRRNIDNVLTNGVVLNRVVGGTPVWRMIIVEGESHNEGGDPADPDDPYTPTRDGVGGGGPGGGRGVAEVKFDPADVERSIYFVKPPNGYFGIGHGKQRHYTSLPANVPIRLLPGRYAVVGSGGESVGASYVTTIGRRDDAEDNGQISANTDLKRNQTRRIVLTPDPNPNVHQVAILDNGTSPPVPPVIQAAIAIPMDRGFEGAFSNADEARNLSISEPLYGYPAVDPSAVPFDAGAASGEGAYPTPYDKPIDFTRADTNSDGEVDGADDGQWSPLWRDGTTNDFRTIHLQRLANPLLAFNPITNPYRTIDSMSVDLTSFNGVQDPAAPVSPDDPTLLDPVPVNFRPLQRGDGGPPNPAAGDFDQSTLRARLLWSHQRNNTQLDNDGDSPVILPTPAGGGTHVFNRILHQHTFGYLNQGYGTRFVPADVTLPTLPANYVGAPNTATPVGDPGNPFPWLTWNNRPFVSQYEMMLVPAYHSAALLNEFDVLNDTEYSFNAATGIVTQDEPSPPGTSPHFRHLLNFFESTGAGGPPGPGGPGGGGTAGNLFRLFEFTHVPSRFVGTETWLNPETFAGGEGTGLRHAPFNRISHYRDPGRMNINTIFSPTVFKALRGEDPIRRIRAFGDATYAAGTPSYDEFNITRRGFAAFIHPDYPTVIARPFRGAGSSEFVPNIPPDNKLLQAEVDGTILRGYPGTGAGDPPRPLFSTIEGGAHNDPNRNPYFRYQSIQRLGNLMTTRSNVYAVWITVGFFEVDPVTGRLGQEIGVISGDVKRHRAFYVIDRSIPVAFEPGENHNVDRAILLRRFIE